MQGFALKFARHVTAARKPKKGLRAPPVAVEPLPGEQGPAGPRGRAGADGKPGMQGPAGKQGKDGQHGPAGARGPKGDKGDRGADGRMGASGKPGQRGAAGRDGERGPKGPKGDKGDKGDRGERGADGRDGDSWYEGVKAPRSPREGWFWFHPDGVIKRWENNRWRLVTTLRGARGPAGRNGNRFLFGFGAPPSGKGQGGDVWFDLEIGDFYLKGRNGWKRYFNVGARAFAGIGDPTEDPHDTDDILEGDEPASEEPSEFESETDSDSSESESETDSESESDFDFG